MMKKLIFNIVVFLLFINSLFPFDNPIGGMSYLQESDGIIRDARFDSESDRIFIVKRVNNSIIKSLEKVFVYRKSNGIERLFFDPSIPLSSIKDGDAVIINSLFVLEDYLVIIVTELRYEGLDKEATEIIKRYKVDKKGFLLEKNIIDRSERWLYAHQSTVYRNIITNKIDEQFTKLDIDNDYLSIFEFSEKMSPDLYNTLVMIEGRQDGEVLFVSPSVYPVKDELRTMKMYFYSLKNKSPGNTVNLPLTLINSLKGNSISDMILSPLGDKVILGHFAYGFWLYDLKDVFFHPLVLLEKYPSKNQIHIKDWSWNGASILVQIGNTLQEIYIEDFLELNPAGITLR